MEGERFERTELPATLPMTGSNPASLLMLAGAALLLGGLTLRFADPEAA